jgi:uncharacterized membrane protein required for colicin V production
MLGIIGVFIFIDYRRGLVHALLKMASVLLTVIIAIALYPVISAVLRSTPLYGIINEAMKTMVGTGGMNSLNLPDFMNVHFTNVTDGITNTLAESLTAVVFNIIAFALVFFIVSAGFQILIRISKVITMLPVIRKFNKLGGAIIGGLKGVLVAWLVCFVMLSVSVAQSNAKLANDIDNSAIAGLLMKNGFTLNMMTRD